MATQTEPVVPIQVKRFEFTPTQIVLKRGVPVILELTSLDVVHGFNVPGLGVRTDVVPGQISQVRLVPERKGRSTIGAITSAGSVTGRSRAPS